MKNLKFVLGVMLTLVMFSACSNDDESENSSSNDVLVLSPVNEGDFIVTFSDFFKNSFATDRNNPFNFGKSISNEENSPCIILNSKRDLEQAYTGDLDLPNIDFSQYTLIIGKIPVSAGTFIDNMVIRKISTKRAALAISCIIDNKGAYIAAMVNAYYWKLFPKFQTSRIEVEVSQNIGDVDDIIKNQYIYE